MSNIIPFRHKPTEKERYVSAALQEWAKFMEAEIQKREREIERFLGICFFVGLVLGVIAVWVFA